MAKTKTLNDLMGSLGSHLESEARRAVRDERRERRAANRDLARDYDREVIAWFRDKQGRPIPITAPSGGRMLRTGKRDGTMRDEKTGKIYKKDGTKVESVTLQDSLSAIQKTYESGELPDEVDYTPQPVLKEVENKTPEPEERLITRGGNVFSVKKGEKWKWLGLDAKTASKPDVATAQKVAQKTAELKEDSQIASGALDLINKDLSSDRQRLKEVEKKLTNYALDDATKVRLTAEKKEVELAIDAKVERQAAAEIDVARAQAEVKAWSEEKRKIISDSVASQQEKLFDPSKLPNTGRLPDASETMQGVVAKVAEDEPREARPIVIQYPGLAKMLEERGETPDPPSGGEHVENPVLTASFVNQWTKTMQAARAGAVGADQLTKSSTLTDLTMPTVDGGYVVPYDLPKAVVDATGYKQANPEWMSEESKERQKTASLSGFDNIQAPPGYELSGGVIYAPPNEPDKFVGITTIPSSKDEPVAVGKFKFDDNGVGYIELDPDLKISPSFASGQYYRGMPEYQGKPKGFTEELRKQASGTTEGTTLKNITTPAGESDWEAISDAAWRGRRWDAIKLRDTLDQWRNANDYERSALIAQIDPRQAELKDTDRKLDTGWLYRQGYLSVQDARMFDKLAHGTEPGYADMPKAFNAWVGVSTSDAAQEFRDIAQKKGEASFWQAAGARLLEVLPSGKIVSAALDLEKQRASSAALYGAKEAFVAEYFQEAKRKVDFNMPAFVAARDKLTGDESYIGWAQNALNGLLQNAISSTGGMLTQALKIEADGVARIFGDSVMSDKELQIIGAQTQSAVQNMVRAMEDRKPDSLGETLLMASPSSYLWNLGDVRDKAWNGKVGKRVKDKIDELYDYVNSGNTTENGLKSRAIELQKDLKEYHGDKNVSGVASWIVGMDGSTRLDFENDFTNKKSAMFENLMAYQQTGAKSYWSAFEAAALNSSHDQYVQKLATDYASANGLIAESSMFGPLVMGFRGGMVAPFTETLVEVGSDVISLGGAKLLTLGRYLKGAERAGLLANRIGRELSRFDELAIAWERLGKTESVVGKELTTLQKGLNKTIDFGKQWAISGATEGFEEVVGAFGESGATLGDAIAQGIGGAIGGIGLSAVHFPLGAAMAQVPIALHRRAQEKAIKNFVRDYNIQNPESPITLKQARAAQNYQDVAVVRQIKETISNIITANDKLNKEAKTLPVMLDGEDGAKLVNPRIKEIVAAQGKLAKGMAFLAPLLDKIQQSSLNAVREIEGLPEEQQALVGAVVAHFAGGVLTNDALRALYSGGSYEAHGKLILPDSLLKSVADIAPRIAADYLNTTEEDQIVEAQVKLETMSVPPPVPTSVAGQATTASAAQNESEDETSQETNQDGAAATPQATQKVSRASSPQTNLWRATLTYTPKGTAKQVTTELSVKANTEAEAQKKISAKVKAIYRIADGPVNVGEIFNMTVVQPPVSLSPIESQSLDAVENNETNQSSHTESAPENNAPENKAFIPSADTGQWTSEAIRSALKQAAAIFGYKIVDTGIDIGVVDRYGKNINLGTQLYDKLVPGSEIGHWMDNIGNSQFAAEIADKISHPGLHRVWFGHDFATNLGGLIDKFGITAIPEYIGQLLKDTLTKSGIPFPGVELLVRSGAVNERVATDWLSVNIGEVFGGGISFFGTYRLYQAAKKNKLTRPKVVFATVGVGLKIAGGVMTAQPFLIISGMADAAILVTHIDEIKDAFRKTMEVDGSTDSSIVNKDANGRRDSAGRNDGATAPIDAGETAPVGRAAPIESGSAGKDSVVDVGNRETKRGERGLPPKAMGNKKAPVAANKPSPSVRPANSKDVDSQIKLLAESLERLAQRLGLPKGVIGDIQLINGDIRTGVYFENDEIIVKANRASLLEQAKILEDEDGGDGVEFLKGLFNEELIHVADILSVRELWLKDGKPGSLEDYWKSFRAETLDRIEEEINNNEADGSFIAEALVKAAANYDSAGRDNSAQFIKDIKGESFIEKANNLIVGLRSGKIEINGLSNSHILISEFLREIIQARRKGQMTETGYRRVVGKLLEWMNELVKILRHVYSISPTVEREIDRIEEILDIAAGLKNELEDKEDEPAIEQKERKQTGKNIAPAISQSSVPKNNSGIAGAERNVKLTKSDVVLRAGETIKPEEESAAMEDAVKDFEKDLTKPQQERLRRVAAKQFSDVERDNTEILRAHDEEGKPLPAPNGKPSKLNRRQWVQVRTPLFKRWFGDWEALARGDKSVNPDSVSKVVDENGEPMVVYHGSNKKFTVFNTINGARASYFTNDKELARNYASGRLKASGLKENKYHSFLSIKNPMMVNADGDMWDNIDIKGIKNNSNAVRDLDKKGVTRITTNRASEIAFATGFDGLVIENVRDGFGYDRAKESNVYSVFRPNQIKSATGNEGMFSGSDNITYSIAGEKAETADKHQLTSAKEMLEGGIDAEKVRQETGWFKGVDEKWRFEINDRDAAFIDTALRKDEDGNLWRNTTLSEIITHPKLFAAYPALRNLLVTLDIGKDEEERGAYNRGKKATAEYIAYDPEINVKAKSKEGALSLLLHEIQHGIQNIEGFATGGNPGQFKTRDTNEAVRRHEDALDRLNEIEKRIEEIETDRIPEVFRGERGKLLREKDMLRRETDIGWIGGVIEARAFQRYKQMSGEVEARNVEARRQFTDEQRREVPLQQTADVPVEDVIVVFDGEEMLSAPVPANAMVHDSSLEQEVRSSMSRETIANQVAREYGIRESGAFRIVVGGTAGDARFSTGQFPDNWEGRSIFDNQDNLLRIELNAGYLNTPEDVRRVLEHELGHAAVEMGLLNQEISKLSNEERKQIAEDMERLGYDAADSKEADARAVDALREAWGERTWFQRIVAPIYDVAQKMGLSLSDEKLRLLAERAAVRAVVAEARKLAERGEQEHGIFRQMLVSLPRADRSRVVNLEGGGYLVPPDVNTRLRADSRFELIGYHGTSHDVDKLSTDKVGTGEGIQAYGWGLYFAGDIDVAKQYQKNLTGNLYTVVLNVEEDDLLDWDKPLNKQSERVQRIINAEQQLYRDSEAKGYQIYNEIIRNESGSPRGGLAKILADAPSPEAAASNFLNAIGIPGIRYLDRGSRGQHWTVEKGGDGVFFAENYNQGQNREFKTREDAKKFVDEKNNEGTYNYVIFDDSKIKITHKNGEAISDSEAGEVVRYSLAERSSNDLVDIEAIKLYFKNNGTPTEAIDEEAERLLRFLREAAGSISSATVEESEAEGKLSQGELFTGTGEAAANQIQVGRDEVSEAGGAGGRLDNLIKGLQGDWSNLAVEINNKGRASSIFADLVSGKIPHWDITGTKIKGPADVFAAILPIRSPYFESLKVMVLDESDNVAFSQIVHVGSLNESIADPKAIFGVLARWREKAKKDYNKIIISHNHPSGNPAPSPADDRLQRRLAGLGILSGWRVIDHVITNGESYYSYKESSPLDTNGSSFDNYNSISGGDAKPTVRDNTGDGKADWEVVKRSDLQVLDQSKKINQVARFLRSGAHDVVHLFYLNSRFGLIGVERISEEDFFNIEKFARILLSGIAREGGYGFALDVGSGGLTTKINNHLKRIKELSEHSLIRFVDAVSGNYAPNGDDYSYQSAYNAGLLKEGPLYGVVKESGESDYSTSQVQGEFNFDEVKSDRSIELINENLGLAHYFANKYANIPNADFDDRLQEARMGLILAAGSFDPSRGVPFGAYASRIIKNRLNALFVSNKRIASNESIELDAPFGGEDGGTDLKSNLRAPETQRVSPEDLAIIADAVGKLPARPRRIWQSLAEGRSLRDIGAQEGLSQEGVRKIANATRNTLRSELGRRGIKSVDDIFPDGRDAFPELNRGVFKEIDDENEEAPAIAAAQRTREAVDNEKKRIDEEVQYGSGIRKGSKEKATADHALTFDRIFSDAKEFYASVFRGRYDKLNFYAPGIKEIILDNKRNEALAVASVNGVIRQMRDDITKAFGYPKFWDKNKKRLQSFLDELLPTAARLEVRDLDDDGNFIFKDFDMRAGTIEASKVRALNLNKGDDIVTDRGTFKLGDEVKDDRFLLLRYIPATVQQVIYDEFRAKYPESAHYLDRWIMPDMQEVGYSAPNGTLRIEFNRHSLRRAFNDWPAELRSLYGLNPHKNVPYVEGYTPDVAEAKTLANLIGSLITLFKSGGRKFKSGDSRESGNIKNLFDGFSVRALEAHREKLRVELRSRIIEKAAIPLTLIPKDRKEDFVPLDQAFFRLYEAAKIGKRLDPNSFPSAEAAFSQKTDKAMAKIFGDAYRLRGRRLMIHRAVSQELMFGMARQMTNNALTRILAGLLERYNAGLLSLPFTAITNWASNEIFKTVKLGNLLNRAILNLALGETKSGKIAVFEFGFLLRGFITDRFPQWQKERIGSIVPRELFADQTGLEAIDIDPTLSIKHQIGRLNIGAALLQAYGYGEIDIRAKQQIAYASYRAHAEIAWREALKRKEIDKSIDKREWLNEWVKSQPNEFHNDVYLTTVLYLMDYQNVPALIDSQQSTTALGQIFKRALIPFAKWPYNMVKQFKRFTFDSAIDVLFFGRTKEQRINGMANLMTMAGLAAVGAAISMADFGGDDEPIIGTGLDEEGNRITDGYKTKNRLNMSRIMRIIFAHGLLRDVDFLETGESDEAKDLYWRYRNYPYIKEAILMGLVLTGRTAKANSLLTEVGDEYLTFGIISKLLLPSSYDNQKSLSWRGAEVGLDLATSGGLPTPWRQLFVGLADPVLRLNKKNDAIDYVGGFTDALKFNTPFLSKTLPVRGQRNPTSLALFSAQDWFTKKRKEIEKSNLSTEMKDSKIKQVADQAKLMDLDYDEQARIFRDAGLPVEKINASKRSSIPIARRIKALKELGLNNDEIALTKSGEVVMPNPDSVGYRPRGLQLLRALGGINVIPVTKKNKDEH